MKILIYGINYSPELTGIGKYTGEMAPWLAAQGHDVRVVTAPPYYPDWKVWKGYSGFWFKTSNENNVRITRCPIYVPRTQSALKRIIHLSSFACSSALALFKNLLWRPDVVFQVAPTMFCCPFTLVFSKLSGAKTVLHIQDFEIDALFGLGMASGNKLKSAAFAIERFLYNRFDRVSSISGSMVQRLVTKGVSEDRVMLFPNWSETARFQLAEKSTELLNNLGVPTGKTVLLYSGNIGEKQGLESVLDAAEKLLTINKDIVVLIVGEGANKKHLMQIATSKNINNVIFAPLQPYELLPTLLASVDVHLVVQKRGAADAVLPSKLTNILAVGGNAVITSDEHTSLGQLCIEHPDIAVRVEPECVDALLKGIEAALNKPSENATAATYAREHLDQELILQKFETELKAIH